MATNMPLGLVEVACRQAQRVRARETAARATSRAGKMSVVAPKESEETDSPEPREEVFWTEVRDSNELEERRLYLLRETVVDA